MCVKGKLPGRVLLFRPHNPDENRPMRFSREVIRVAKFEKDQIIVAEIVPVCHAFSERSPVSPAPGIEYACERIDSAEDIAVVGIIPSYNPRSPRRSP